MPSGTMGLWAMGWGEPWGGGGWSLRADNGGGQRKREVMWSGGTSPYIELYWLVFQLAGRPPSDPIFRVTRS